jgi:uncharacterized protein
VRFSQADTDGGYVIQRYEPGCIVVNEREFRGSFIVSPQRLVPQWRPRQIVELTAEDLAPALDLSPQILLLGTGPQQVFPRREHLTRLLPRGIGLEIMDTGAACRTYNILMSEGRRVAAALIML